MLSTPADTKKKLEQNWIQYLKAYSAKLAFGAIDGSSPPSVFVGRYGYPKVSLGPMIPPFHGDTSILDKTELWTGKSIEEIVNYRLSLVRGTFTMNVKDTVGRFLENIQEVAMSERPAETEATFEKKPLADLDFEKEIHLNTEVAPFGPAAPIKTFKASSLAADPRIEAAFYDNDLKASDAIIELYRRGVAVSSIHKVLSVGMLGIKKSRRLVPTRWSISAVDDIISSRMIEDNVAYNPTIDLIEVMQYSHLANNYSVMLMPDDRWSFEMIESWITGSGQIGTYSEYEDARGLDHYPAIAGAYYAARLAVAEHLSRRRRKAKVLVLREIHPEYVVPLGVWQVREGIREALRRPPQKFESFDRALSFACEGMSMSRQEVARQSVFWRTFKGQKRITDFA